MSPCVTKSIISTLHASLSQRWKYCNQRCTRKLSALPPHRQFICFLVCFWFPYLQMCESFFPGGGRCVKAEGRLWMASPHLLTRLRILKYWNDHLWSGYTGSQAVLASSHSVDPWRQSNFIGSARHFLGKGQSVRTIGNILKNAHQWRSLHSNFMLLNNFWKLLLTIVS